MLKTLKKHILSEFLKLLAITGLSLTSLFLLIDVVEKGDDLLEHGVPFLTSMAYFALKLPYVVCQIMPMSMLLATLISLAMLNRHGEITAIKAGGISITRALTPLFAAGLVVSAAVLFINETATPAATRLVDSIEREWMQNKDGGLIRGSGLWIKKGEHIYNIKKIDMENKTLEGISSYSFKPPFSLYESTKARKAAWKAEGEGGSWVARKAVITSFNKDGTMSTRKEKKLPLKGLDTPGSLSNVKQSYETMSFTELLSYTRALEDEGYETKKYRTELYSKITFPLVNLIMILIAIPFAIRSGRNSAVASGVALSVLIGVSYWIVFGISRSLGAEGIVPPIVAAAFPDVLFLSIGVLMFGYVKQ
jgi:lipopolysaccharide export system permease protein